MTKSSLKMILCTSHFLLQFTNVQCLVLPIEIPAPLATMPMSVLSSSGHHVSKVEGAFLLAALQENQQQNSDELSFSTKRFQRDQVVRVLDANTLKLKNNGIVTLAGIRMPTPGKSNFQFPECLSYSSAYKLRQLVPKNSNVLVKVMESNKTPRQAIVVVRGASSELVVNQELVKTGFAKVQRTSNPALQEYLDLNLLQSLQDQAKSNGLGIFKQCDNIPAEAQFEALELTVETKWGDDGGKQVLRQRETAQGKPKNPGDRKGCSDFDTYEGALHWYEQYKPFYGDVAKLDRNGDGVPCPGLPHTTNRDIYRMKVPKAVK